MIAFDLNNKGESAVAFTYDEATTSAFDGDKNVSIVMSQKFTDSYPVMLYEYIENGKKFEFSLVTKSEYRRCIFRGREVNMRIPLSITIGERLLDRATHAFLQETPKRTEEYIRIKENIRDGVLCIATLGGEIADLTPGLVILFGEIRSN